MLSVLTLGAGLVTVAAAAGGSEIRVNTNTHGFLDDFGRVRTTRDI